MANDQYCSLDNGSALDLQAIPMLSMEAFREQARTLVTESNRVALGLFALPDETDGDRFQLLAVLGNATTQKMELFASEFSRQHGFLSLTDERCGAFHYFEREIAEAYHVAIEGHPWLKGVRFPHAGQACGMGNFYTPSGAVGHEVAVGPVHAGVIEPGHFRFQCLGETIEHLEISLGYQHRGVEQLLLGGPDMRTLPILETAAGDSSIAAALAYAMNIEALALTPGLHRLHREDHLLRTILMELERIANHVGDLGALAGDVAFLPTASFCGRIRGEYLNMSAAIATNRFGRHVITPGGVRMSLDREHARQLLDWVKRVQRDLVDALKLMFDAPSVLDRLESTGVLKKADAHNLGALGVAGRASGVDFDARRDLPYGSWRYGEDIAVAKHQDGDVLSRALIRYWELKASHEWLTSALSRLAAGSIAPARVEKQLDAEIALTPGHIALSAVEAWRGTLLHCAVTDRCGKFRSYRIVDSSFHNWYALAVALRGEEISNFPICNKSFNLSYCGHDL